MARALNLGTRCRTRAYAAAHRRMRAKLRSPAGQAAYARRKAVVEPVFGVLKQQRGIRQFRTRGLNRVTNEFTLATLAYNITRLHALRAAWNKNRRPGGENSKQIVVNKNNGVLTQTLMPQDYSQELRTA
jgi:hypothetical protein